VKCAADGCHPLFYGRGKVILPKTEGSAAKGFNLYNRRRRECFCIADIGRRGRGGEITSASRPIWGNGPPACGKKGQFLNKKAKVEFGMLKRPCATDEPKRRKGEHFDCTQPTRRTAIRKKKNVGFRYGYWAVGTKRLFQRIGHTPIRKDLTPNDGQERLPFGLGLATLGKGGGCLRGRRSLRGVEKEKIPATGPTDWCRRKKNIKNDVRKTGKGTVTFRRRSLQTRAGVVSLTEERRRGWGERRGKRWK